MGKKKKVERIISEINKREHHFCSRECQFKWQLKYPNKKFIYSNIGRKPSWTGKGKDNINGLNKDTWRKEARKKIWGSMKSPHKNIVIHHIDEDVSNNHISNLLVMDRGEHSRLHNLGGFR